MVQQVEIFSLREFHNLAPYMEMHIDFALVLYKSELDRMNRSVQYHIQTHTVLKKFANYFVIHYEKPST